MGKQRKQMHKNKAAWKTSGVGCEKLESIFTMHASQFSLLLCHCFEKSKLCLQKCNVCIHMYESMQLSRGEAGKRNGRFCFQKEPEASGKIHFLPQVSGGSRQQTLLRDVLKGPVITQGGFYVSLEPTFFPPFLQSSCLYLFLAYGSRPGLLPTSGFQPRRFCFPRHVFVVVVVTGRMLLTPSGYRSGAAMKSCKGQPHSQIPWHQMSVVPRLSHSLHWAPSSAARVTFTS